MNKKTEIPQLPSSPEDGHRTPEERLADQDTRERLGAVSLWHEVSEAPPKLASISKPVVRTSEQEQLQQDLEDQRRKGVWDNAA